MKYLTRDDVLSEAIDKCFKEIYSYVQPSVEWDEFIALNKTYSEAYNTWEEFNRAFHKREESPKIWEEHKSKHPEWENKSITECIGPRPFEYYYISREIIKSIHDSYVYAYRIDSQQELLNTIAILKNYCEEPIVDKYVDDYTDEKSNHHPGYKSYDHPDNLEKEINKIISDYLGEEEGLSKEITDQVKDKFFRFLDMAGEFYCWNRDLNTFSMSVYMGPSPNTNKEEVIKNWKKYKNIDIEIDEKQIKDNYYGEDYD